MNVLLYSDILNKMIMLIIWEMLANSEWEKLFCKVTLCNYTAKFIAITKRLEHTCTGNYSDFGKISLLYPT